MYKNILINITINCIVIIKFNIYNIRTTHDEEVFKKKKNLEELKELKKKKERKAEENLKKK